jgi:hypothetical protein
MPIPDARQSGASSAGASSLSWSHTVGAGLSNTILEVMPQESSGTGISVSTVVWDDGGANTPLTRKGRTQDAGTGWAENWFLLSPASGTKTIKVTNTGSCACTAGSASYSDVDQVTPFNAASPQTATGSGGTASLNVTSASGELVIDSINDNTTVGPDTLVPNGSQTQIHSITVSNNTSGGSSDKPGAPSVTMSWTGLNGSPPWALVGVSLRPASPPPRRLARILAPQQRMLA